MLAAIAFDASSELNVYALETPARGESLVTRLRDEAPRVADLLREGELLVDLVVGSDLDYDSVLTVHSRVDIGTEVAALAQEAETSIRAYEDGPRVTTPEELDSSIRSLMGVDD
jgi:hypothetical protein